MYPIMDDLAVVHGANFLYMANRSIIKAFLLIYDCLYA